MIFDFFNDFDKNLYPTIKQALDNQHLFIIHDKEQNGDGYSICNPYSNNPYTLLFINEKMQLNNVSCLVHELGHVISYQTSKPNPKFFNQTFYNSYVEVPSFTFEFLFLNFLLQNKLYVEETEKVIHNNFSTLNYYLGFLKVINRVIDNLNLFYEYEADELKKILKQAGIVKDDLFCELCFSDITLKYNYSYGELIGQYYLSKYKIDEEKTKVDIMNFINSIGNFDDFYMLNNFGININEFKKCKYLEEEVLRNQKQLTKNTH